MHVELNGKKLGNPPLDFHLHFTPTPWQLRVILQSAFSSNTVIHPVGNQANLADEFGTKQSYVLPLFVYSF